MDKTVYMVIENFRNGDPVPVYRRFRDRGRLAPEGLNYVSSWVDQKLERCYQKAGQLRLDARGELSYEFPR